MNPDVPRSRQRSGVLQGPGGTLRMQAPRWRVLADVRAEHVGEPTAARRRKPDCSAVAHAGDPAEIEAASADLGADVSRKMVASLTPVEAGTAVDPAPFWRRIRAELRQQSRAAGCEFAALVRQDQMS